MCVWCAYAGKRPAAPLLWESLRGIEGLWGGFYTGLVTLQNQEFKLGKCQGSSDCWAKKFNLADFPGNAGLMHSRTDSGGDDRYAHPFVGGKDLVAAVSQGSLRVFRSEAGKFGQKGDWLLQHNCTFHGANNSGESIYNFKLSGNLHVPLSEISTNLTEYYYAQSGDPLQAMRRTAVELPEESATIFLFADRPDTIGVINVNQHVVAFQEGGEVFLAVTALGWPQLSGGKEIPGNTVALLTADSCQTMEISPRYAVDPTVPADAQEVALNYIAAHPGTLLGHMIDQALWPLFPDSDKLQYRAVCGYRAIEALAQQGKIYFEPEIITGATGAPARIFKIFCSK